MEVMMMMITEIIGSRYRILTWRDQTSSASITIPATTHNAKPNDHSTAATTAYAEVMPVKAKKAIIMPLNHHLVAAHP